VKIADEIKVCRLMFNISQNNQFIFIKVTYKGYESITHIVYMLDNIG